MKKNIFSGITLALFIAISFYISGIGWWINFIVSLMIYAFIFFLIHILWSKIRKNITMNFVEFIKYFSYRISIFLIFITTFFSAFIYYENIYEPALLPEFTLSNWDKTIVFQWMAHIGSDSFYNNVKNNIKEYKNKWFVLFYEWVKPWSKENSEKFNKLLWVEFNKQTYVNLSKIYALRAQNNQEFLNIVNNKDYNIDVSMDNIISNYEQKYSKITGTKWNNKIWDSPVKIDSMINDIVENMTDRELKIFIALNRSIMNFIIKNDNVRNSIMEWAWQQKLFDIILNDRNSVIVDSINKSDNKKIVILYWLMHFDWVWSQLQKQDSNWKLLNIRYFKPID